MKNKWLWFSLIWFLASLYGFILHESSGSHAPPFPHFDKVAHCLVFFVQFWVLCRAFILANKRIPLILLWCLAVIYAATSEWAQATFTLTRQGDFWDAVADVIGASMALYLGQIFQKKKQLIH